MGLSGTAGGLAYTTTKAGLHGFTLSVAADYAVHGIRANTLVVGTVNTPLVAHLGEEGRERMHAATRARRRTHRRCACMPTGPRLPRSG